MTLDRSITNNAIKNMAAAIRVVRPRDPEVRSMLFPAALRDMECGVSLSYTNDTGEFLRRVTHSLKDSHRLLFMTIEKKVRKGMTVARRETRLLLKLEGTSQLSGGASRRAEGSDRKIQICKDEATVTGFCIVLNATL